MSRSCPARVPLASRLATQPRPASHTSIKIGAAYDKALPFVADVGRETLHPILDVSALNADCEDPALERRQADGGPGSSSRVSLCRGVLGLDDHAVGDRQAARDSLSRGAANGCVECRYSDYG